MQHPVRTPAEVFADQVLRENYCDEDDPDIPVSLDARVDPPPRVRDVRAWLIQGYDAGRAGLLTHDETLCGETGCSCPCKECS